MVVRNLERIREERIQLDKPPVTDSTKNAVSKYFHMLFVVTPSLVRVGPRHTL